VLVVSIGHEELERLVQRSDRNSVLRELHERAIVEGNGA
jgi:hypothetical protein